MSHSSVVTCILGTSWLLVQFIGGWIMLIKALIQSYKTDMSLDERESLYISRINLNEIRCMASRVIIWLPHILAWNCSAQNNTSTFTPITVWSHWGCGRPWWVVGPPFLESEPSDCLGIPWLLVRLIDSHSMLVKTLIQTYQMKTLNWISGNSAVNTGTVVPCLQTISQEWGRNIIWCLSKTVLSRCNAVVCLFCWRRKVNYGRWPDRSTVIPK